MSLYRVEVQGFIERCMMAVGTKPHHARSLAEVLVAADSRGHYSHGLNRMDMYVKDIKSGVCAVDGEPLAEKQSAATALVDGKNLLGPVVGNFCMNLAIRKAKEVGIGWVVAHGSNHFGIAGFYAMQALKDNMIGMSFTNTSPLVVPTRGKERTLGTNPLSVAAPAKDGDSFVLDTATSAVALGKVELSERHGDSIPDGWGCDPQGKITADPKRVLTGGGLVPIGGSEATGQRVSLEHLVRWVSLGGALARPWGHGEGMIRTPWVVVGCLSGAGGVLLGKCFSNVVVLPQADPDAPVLTPGDPERASLKKCEEMGGILYHINVVKYMNDYAKKIGVSELLPCDETVTT
uniref:Malate dehydrogenase n=1 Tax=Oryzias sinensis TaxID=183150 RepID=A0A8C7ZR18_9TELE